MKVIDFRVRLNTPEMMAGLYPEVRKEWKEYATKYKWGNRVRICPVEENLEEMEQSGITRAVVIAPSPKHNAYLHDLCRRYPGRLLPLASVAPEQGIMEALYELEKCYDEYGFYGFNLGAFMTGIPASDRIYYPLYALSEKLGKIVVIHSSLHYNPYQPIEVCDPRHVDVVGSHFHGLTLVMSHAGVGFGLAPNAVAHRLPNVYMEYSALKPQYQRPEAIHAMNSFLKKRTLFGTDYPTVPFSIVDDWKEVIKEENHRDFFCDNACRALGLTE